ncbi:MAG: glycosyltransferase family 4 protein [Ardenticatenia bacterium]|nr:glycosyltransferase family 4 protein [Ardenticatenia bacterium]
MRILYIIHQYVPEHVGGTERYTQAVSRELARRGHRVTIFYRQSRPGLGWHTSSEKNIQLYSVWDGILHPTRRFFSVFRQQPIARLFERVLHEVQPDLVHVQHLMGLPELLIRHIRSHGLPLFITLHDYWWVCANAQLLTNYKGHICDGPRMYINCARCGLTRAGYHKGWNIVIPVLAGVFALRNHKLFWILREADQLIAPSQFVLRQYVMQGIPEDHITVIPHGIEIPGALNLRSRISYTEPKSMRFAYIGGLAWQKGVHVIIEAFRNIHGPAELWIAGDETPDPTYAAYLRERAPHNVQFMGKLSYQEVWNLLNHINTVLIPSLWYETFSLIAHEAFAVGLPVVASKIGALAEVVHDGINGLLVTPGDVHAWQETLQRLVSYPHFWKQLALSVSPPMTIEQHVDRLEDLYNQSAARPR